MKKYNKRINIWIDEDFEKDIEEIKKYMKVVTHKDCGNITNSDVIRYVVGWFYDEMVVIPVEDIEDN
jgi:hypothetical protein